MSIIKWIIAVIITIVIFRIYYLSNILSGATKLIVAVVVLVVLFVSGSWYFSTSLLSKAVEDCSPGLARYSIFWGGDVNAMHDRVPLLMSTMPHMFDKCPELFDMLVDEGADVNARGEWNEPMLYYSSYYYSDVELTKMLINAGADVNTNIPVVHFKEEAPLLLEISCYPQGELNKEIVQLYIDAGVNVNVTGYSSTSDEYYGSGNIKETTYNPLTPLMCAVGARFGNVQFVKTLLDAGANVNFVDDSGNTVLHRAITNKNPEFLADKVNIIKSLIDAGANVNAMDKHGQTVLHYAASEYNPNEYDEYDEFKGHNKHNKEIVKLLIDSGADVNAVDNDGKTALYMATKVGNDDNVKLLIDAGADATITNK